MSYETAGLTPRLSIQTFTLWCSSLALLIALMGFRFAPFNLPLLVLKAGCMAASIQLICSSPGLPCFAKLHPGHLLAGVFAAMAVCNAIAPYPLVGPRTAIAGPKIAAVASVVMACQLPWTNYPRVWTVAVVLIVAAQFCDAFVSLAIPLELGGSRLWHLTNFLAVSTCTIAIAIDVLQRNVRDWIHWVGVCTLVYHTFFWAVHTGGRSLSPISF